jgi:cephalosporin hydroxylase
MDANIATEFHRAWYDSGVWHLTKWRGRPIQKCPMDLFVYQEILSEKRPEFIIETGSYWGGSACFLRDMLLLLEIEAKVVTIDINPPEQSAQVSGVEYVKSSSSDPELATRLAHESQGRKTMVILDSDHTCAHVSRELELYAPLVSPGQYLIVEDTNINGHPVLLDFGPGPMEATDEFLTRHSEFERDLSREKHMLTQNPGGYLRRVS